MSPDAALYFLLDVLIDFAIFLIVVLSLNLEVGYAGVPNFGRVLAVAGGGFVVGYLPGRLALERYGVEYDFVSQNAQAVGEIRRLMAGDVGFAVFLLIVSLAVAMAAGAALGYLASRPAIRLREDYLAMTLLIMGDALIIIALNYPPLVGGTLGVHIPPVYEVIFGGGLNRYIYSTVFTLAVAGAVFYLVYRLTKSPYGRLLKAVRDNELAAAAFGRDVVSVRTKVLILGGALAALAGALYAFYVGSVHARTYDKVVWTFYPWLVMLLGGMANNLGVVVGTFTFVLVRKLIIYFKYDIARFVPFDVVWLEYILFGTVLLIILMLRPQGIIPERAEPVLDKREIRKIVEAVKSSK
jgi:branched-chain amino acid transport system permease protein